MPGVGRTIRPIRNFLAEHKAAVLQSKGELLSQDRPLFAALLIAEITEVERTRRRVKIAMRDIGDELPHGRARIGEPLA